MNYSETLSYIMDQLPMFHRIGKLAYRTGLDNTLKLDDYFNHPHNSFKTIHVAGTNGKGSVSHMLASVLQEAGYRVGLYTSPHLIDFRERIRINGKMITKSFVTEFVNSHKTYFETFDPSFFEISVFMAFEYFKQNHVDIAVIEVGLGGRLDATNIIHPEISVITNIGKDHTEILGDTLQKIAAEKAGIIKEKVPVVIGESHPETLPVFQDIAKQQHAPLHIADKRYQIDYSLISVDGYQVFNVKRETETVYADLKCGLMGHYQRKNVITVLAALNELQVETDFRFDPVHIYDGIRKVTKNTGLSGRWQIMHHEPEIICDTAHNADGMRVVLQQIKDTPYKNLHLLVGFVNDKDIHEILKQMPVKATYYFVRLPVPRTLNEKELATTAAQYGLNGQTFLNMQDAFNKVSENAGRDDLVVITGSNFLVADLLSLKLNIKNDD